MNPVQLAIEAIDPPTQTELARLLGLHRQQVNAWVQTGKLPAVHAIKVEALTGGKVTRYQLRQDVFGKAPPKAKAA